MYRKIWESNDKEDKDKNIKMGVTLAMQCDVDVRTVRIEWPTRLMNWEG